MVKIPPKFEALNGDDVIEAASESIYDLIRQSVAEATRNGIKANSIVINKNMVRVPEQFGSWPEMICGLNCYFTAEELPDGYAFSVQHAPGLDKKDTFGDWIPVGERQPDKELDEIAAVVNTELHWPGFQCLAMIRDAKYPTILNYADIDGDRVWVDDECNWYPVTHWMPLPKPPKEG